MLPSIAAFQLVGYSAWNGEDAGSNPACYTWICSCNWKGHMIFNRVMPGWDRTGYRVRWCKSNIIDCRSAVTGSTPVRTALPGGVTGNTPDFGSGIPGSKPGLVTLMLALA